MDLSRLKKISVAVALCFLAMQSYCQEDRIVQCLVCNGTGRDICSKCKNIGYLRCSKCNNTGYIDCNICHNRGYLPCSKCNDKGYITCKDCRGTGYSGICHQCQNSGYEICSRCDKGYITVPLNRNEIKTDKPKKAGCPKCHGKWKRPCRAYRCVSGKGVECYSCKGTGRKICEFHDIRDCTACIKGKGKLCSCKPEVGSACLYCAGTKCKKCKGRGIYILKPNGEAVIYED